MDGTSSVIGRGRYEKVAGACDVEVLRECLEENKGNRVKCQAHIDAFRSSYSFSLTAAFSASGVHPTMLQHQQKTPMVYLERDPSYDDMLKHMVGRIATKPRGKPEMDEYRRLLPKVRTSEPEPGQGGHRQLPPETLNVAHIQEIIQLYQGSCSSHHGSMSMDKIQSRSPCGARNRAVRLAAT